MTNQLPRRALIVKNNFSPTANKIIQSGHADQEQMQRALQECRKTGKPLVEVLQAITGQALPPDLIRYHKRQQLFELKILYGVEALDSEIGEVSSEQINQLIDTLIPIDLCRRFRMVPMARTEEPPLVVVAMVDPDHLEAQDELNRVLRPHNLGLRRLVMTEEDYQRLIKDYLDNQVAKKEVKSFENHGRGLSDDELIIDANLDIQDASPEEEGEGDIADSVREAAAAPVIRLVNQILAKALLEKVSDIHVEPQEEFLRVRFRKDGVLQQAFPNLPKRIIPAVISRLKIIADLDIAERRLPQDGRIRRMFEGRKVDFRVSSLPSRYGEKVVMRILDNSATQLGLDKLIGDPACLEMVREMARRPFGLILVTGPTGSGKSTTLYSILSERNDPGINISTAEDPIEYALPGITQVQVMREKGMDFPAILRSFLRQDPDVILVGETRDRETAKTAIEASLTGHLVLTTLHTNDAAGAVSRLDEMGVEPYMVSGALIGVVAQRLMRRVCSECRVPYQPTPTELSRFGFTSVNEDQFTFYRAHTVDPVTASREKQPLCSRCGGVGYKGRCGVYEVMSCNERLQKLINQGAPTEQIKEAAVEDGMVTLLAYSLNLVRQGLTTLEEVERVTFTDTALEAELKAKRKSSLTCHVCGAETQPDWLDCIYCTTPRFRT